MGKGFKKIFILSSLVLGIGVGLYSSGQNVSADEKPMGVMGSKVPGTEKKSNLRSISGLVKTVANKSNSVPDISEWQGKLTDAKVKSLKSRTPFIILRVQYGSDYYDKQINNNIKLMEKYGVPYGVYSFSQYESVEDAKIEATDLYNRAKNAKFFVNDYEDQTVKNVNTSDQAAKEWYQTINKLTGGGKKILLYSYASFMKNYASEAVKTYDGFWLAAYQNNEPEDTAHDMWQYTDAYTNSGLGGAVDASITSHDSDWYLNGKAASSGYYKNVTVRSNNYNLWSNLRWTHALGRSHTGDNYEARYSYLVNGTTYYSLYDGKGNWKGYVNSGAVKNLTAESYATKIDINKEGYGIWGDLLWKYQVSTSDKNIGRALNVRYKYSEGDGTYFYSLYDDVGNWVGYLRNGATKNSVTGYHKNVAVRSNNYNLWSNLQWTHALKKGEIGKRYEARYYYFINGTTYYSLYDEKGNWKGYINSEAVNTI